MRAEDLFRRGPWVVWATGLILLLGGCGSGDKQGTGASGSKSTHAARKARQAATPGELALAEMVAAVSASKAGPPVEMKFFMANRPEVGQVLELQVAVIPRAPVPDSLAVSFQVLDGLEIIEGSQLERVDKLVDGTPIRHVLKVLPKRDGIFALSAVVSYAVANQEMSRTFSIPVIAGEGMPEQVAKGP